MDRVDQLLNDRDIENMRREDNNRANDEANYSKILDNIVSHLSSISKKIYENPPANHHYLYISKCFDIFRDTVPAWYFRINDDADNYGIDFYITKYGQIAYMDYDTRVMSDSVRFTNGRYAKILNLKDREAAKRIFYPNGRISDALEVIKLVEKTIIDFENRI